MAARIRVLVEWDPETGEANIHYEGPSCQVETLRTLVNNAVDLLEQQSSDDKGMIHGETSCDKCEDEYCPNRQEEEKIEEKPVELPPWLRRK